MNKLELKAMVIRKGYDYKTLCEKINIPYDTLMSAISRDKVTFEQARAISDFLELSADEIKNIFFNGIK